MKAIFLDGVPGRLRAVPAVDSNTMKAIFLDRDDTIIVNFAAALLAAPIPPKRQPQPQPTPFP